MDNLLLEGRLVRNVKVRVWITDKWNERKKKRQSFFVKRMKSNKLASLGSASLPFILHQFNRLNSMRQKRDSVMATKTGYSPAIHAQVLLERSRSNLDSIKRMVEKASTYYAKTGQSLPSHLSQALTSLETTLNNVITECEGTALATEDMNFEEEDGEDNGDD